MAILRHVQDGAARGNAIHSVLNAILESKTWLKVVNGIIYSRILIHLNETSKDSVNIVEGIARGRSLVMGPRETAFLSINP
jgi:hypothetical protein